MALVTLARCFRLIRGRKDTSPRVRPDFAIFTSPAIVRDRIRQSQLRWPSNHSPSVYFVQLDGVLSPPPPCMPARLTSRCCKMEFPCSMAMSRRDEENKSKSYGASDLGSWRHVVSSAAFARSSEQGNLGARVLTPFCKRGSALGLRVACRDSLHACR